MFYVENLIRRVARMIGWEITGAIESIVWSVGIGCFLILCAVCACLGVGWKIFASMGR